MKHTLGILWKANKKAQFNPKLQIIACLCVFSSQKKECFIELNRKIYEIHEKS